MVMCLMTTIWGLFEQSRVFDTHTHTRTHTHTHSRRRRERLTQAEEVCAMAGPSCHIALD